MSTILVVEDEKEIRLNLVELFESESYEVYSAKDGLEGYELALKHLPDLIISDIKMPRMDGFELFQKVFENKETNSIPFVFLSAKAELADFRAGMSLGADDYLIKPINVDEILRTVKTRIEKKEREKESLEEFKNSLIRKVPHELRTPLIGIMGFAELLNDDFDSLSKDEIKEMIKIIRNSGHRLHKRIEKLLSYSELLASEKEDFAARGTTYEIDPEFMTYRANQLNEEMKRSNDVLINLDKTKIAMSEKHFELVVSELLENALKYSPNGSPIKVTGIKRQDSYDIEVEDYGPGFPDNTLQRINLFHQFGEEKDFTIGLGLGLAMIKKILKIYNGSIGIERLEGNRTLVSAKIPVVT